MPGAPRVRRPTAAVRDGTGADLPPIMTAGRRRSGVTPATHSQVSHPREPKLLAGSLPAAARDDDEWQAGHVAEHAPASTYVLVVGVMATFSAFGIVLIFTPPWYFYLIPLALATPVIVILARRWVRHRAMKRELAGTLSGL